MSSLSCKPCPHRGRIVNGQAFCRHPAANGGGTKSWPVPLSICETCPVPTDAKAAPTLHPISAVPLTQTATGAVVPQLQGGPGTELVKIFKAAGIPGCQQCYALAARMDAWGVDGCRQRRPQIVAEIMPRAEQWKSEGRWKRAIPAAGLRASVSAAVKLAIRQAARQADS